MDNSNDGGDQNPMKRNLDKSHILSSSSKIKIDTNKEGEDEEILENEIGLEHMDLDTNAEEIKDAN
jgi:hypothetical protein